MSHHSHHASGFALPVTLFALVVIGAIVTGGFYASAQESRVSASSDLGAQAFAVAEYGLNEVMGAWKNKDVIEAANDGNPRTGHAWADSRYLGPYTATVRSLGGRLFLIRVAGTATRGPHSTTRVLGSLGRTTAAGLPYESAMTVLGTLEVSGNATIDGEDLCDPSNPKPGVSTPAKGNVTTSGNNADIQGDPEPVVEDTDMDEAKLSQFGDVSLEELIKWATKVYPPSDATEKPSPATTTNSEGETVCDTSLRTNWGNPADGTPCRDYYPIIYAEADLFTLDGAGGGSIGQGILIVENDLHLKGNIEFKGVVIVKGTLEYSGTGGHVEGSIIVMDNAHSTSSGSSEASFNSCLVKEAFDNALRPRSLESRAWVDLTSAAALPST